ncbi:ATP-binding cassette domain-containing protein [Candidatus Bathyarchaeota archaeon]|nr:ATP-binding cassette domain-containing protein [Candidatus Bathyarchaeota archaeon]
MPPSLPEHTTPGGHSFGQDPAPEQTCSWFSYYCSYQWFTPTISKGARNELAKEDLPTLPWYDDPRLLLSKVRMARKWGKTTFWTTLRLVYLELIAMALWVSASHTIELLAPLGLYQLLAYIDNPSVAVLRPWVWLALIFAGPSARAVAYQQYLFTSTRLIVRIKSALTQELYHMALDSMEMEDEDSDLRDGAGRKQTTTAAGRLANLMAADIDAIFKARDIMRVGIGCPITITLALIGLYQIIGWPSLVGTAILILSSVASIYTAQLMVAVQNKAREAQDARMSLITEYLSLIRAVKYFAWEGLAVGKVQTAREAEQQHLWRITVIDAMVGVINQTFPYFALLAMFGLHVFVQQKPMTSSVAFTTVYLVKTIGTKFTNMANTSKAITAAVVAFRRLDKYFGRSRPLQRYPPGPARICDGAFRPSVAATFRLRDINIDFVEGGLNVVTGQSGSGKTTLLLSLLGETIRESGSVTRPPEIAYASQTAWLQNGTIKDNIVFPEVYEPTRYQRIIDSCCLGPDLGQFPEGDGTMIGENGASLSGGQRARAALARALYSKAPMILLDDVFSALDAKTAAMLWELCFCGDLLRGRTVLLVTQVPWIAAQADLEITLENGMVKGIEQHLGVVRTPVSVDAALATGEGLRGPDAHGSGGTAATPDGAKARSIDLVDAEMKARKPGRMIGKVEPASAPGQPLSDSLILPSELYKAKHLVSWQVYHALRQPDLCAARIGVRPPHACVRNWRQLVACFLDAGLRQERSCRHRPLPGCLRGDGPG